MADTPRPLAPGGHTIPRMLARSPVPLHSHAGLIFDRYLSIWKKDPMAGAPTRVKELQRPLSEFVSAYNSNRNNPSHARALLSTTHERLSRAVGHRHGLEATYRVAWRLVSGLGTSHPIENGFTFDPLIGVPYLPGSSVKGLCRNAAALKQLAQADQDRLFGPAEIDSDDSPASTGLICFHDAYPTRWPRLAVDVVNCHHPRYYAMLAKSDERSSRPRPHPRETEDPVPVFFLSVDQGTELTFRIRSRRNDPGALTATMDLLSFGLEYLGIAAKTSVGYGVMEAT